MEHLVLYKDTPSAKYSKGYQTIWMLRLYGQKITRHTSLRVSFILKKIEYLLRLCYVFLSCVLY